MPAIKTAELEGVALDWSVAKCEGYRATIKPGELVYTHSNGNWQPSTNWAQGGPIIERETIDFRWVGIANCRAAIEWVDECHAEAFGPTPLIAAMRCYVASKMGDTVEVPNKLTKGAN